MSTSVIEDLAALDPDEQDAILSELTDEELDATLRDWRTWARDEQLDPVGNHTIWPYVAGRGGGKTRAGAEWTLDRCEVMAERGGGQVHRVTFVGRTAGDMRDIQIEGESGLIACAERRGHVVDYEPSKRRATLPDLNTVITLRSAEEPEGLRGPNQHTAWADEPGAWTHKVDAQGGTAWSNLLLGLRLDPPPATELMPRVCATTTPRPIPLIIEWFVNAGLIPDPETGKLREPDPTLAITRGSMLDNLGNLSAAFVQQIVGAYGGTTLGAQEIMGELVSAVEGALWRPEDIRRATRAPRLGMVVVGVDPPGSTTGAECGIIVAGSAHKATEGFGTLRHGYVLDDLSVRGRTEQWAAAAVAAYRHYKATAIVAEVNFGGDMVRAAVHAVDPTIPVKMVRAGRGMNKTQRAVPVSLLYQQHRVHHVGQFGLLEAQMLTWVEEPGSISPDRMDALVWALRYLLPSLSMAPSRSVSTAGQRMTHGAAAATKRGARKSVSRSPAATPIRLARNTGRRT